MMETYLITIGKDEYQVEANSVEEAQAKIKAAVPNTPVGTALEATGYDKTKPVPEASWFEKPMVVERNGSRIDFPSPERLVDFIPGVTGTVGAALGGPPGAALGAAGGEAWRQNLRRLAGVAPSTGFVQNAIGLDPNSPGAAAVSMGAEALGAGGMEKGMAKLVETIPGLREAAARWYAGMFPVKSGADEVAARATMVDRIMGRTPSGSTLEGASILDQLPGPKPWNTRIKINQAATTASKASGKAVGDVYNVDVPSSFKPVIDRLQALADREVSTPAQWLDVPSGPGGALTDVHQPAAIDDKLLNRAFEAEADKLAEIEAKRNAAVQYGRTPTEPFSIRDVAKSRASHGRQAVREKQTVMTPGGIRSMETPKSQAMVAARDSMAEDILHTPRGAWTADMAKAGEVADAIHTAWKTVQTGTKGKDPGGAAFVARWTISRLMGGAPGTMAGAVAAHPAFWTTAGSRSLLNLSRAIQAGNEVEAEHIFRTMVDAYSQPAQPSPGE